MIRPELHTVRRAFFDCTSLRRPAPVSLPIELDEALRPQPTTMPVPSEKIRNAEIKAALRLAA